MSTKEIRQLKKWIVWKLVHNSDPDKRPFDLPLKVPDEWHAAYAWFVPWGRWDIHGQTTARPTNPRPPSRIPVWAQQLEKQPNVAAKLRKLGSYKPSAVILPAWGQIVPGGQSLLDYDMTHLTTGVGWPAVDAGWETGKPIYAHANCEVYDNTSDPQGGDAFYIRDDTGCEHWVAHITTVPKLNRKFRKGEKMTAISEDHEHPHVHWAINAVSLMGKHLLYGKTGKGPNYTHCPWTVREQFEKALL